MDENHTLHQSGTFLVGEDLYGFSIHELENRILAFLEEIKRVEVELKKKKDERSAADSVFGAKT